MEFLLSSTLTRTGEEVVIGGNSRLRGWARMVIVLQSAAGARAIRSKPWGNIEHMPKSQSAKDLFKPKLVRHSSTPKHPTEALTQSLKSPARSRSKALLFSWIPDVPAGCPGFEMMPGKWTQFSYSGTQNVQLPADSSPVSLSERLSKPAANAKRKFRG